MVTAAVVNKKYYIPQHQHIVSSGFCPVRQLWMLKAITYQSIFTKPVSCFRLNILPSLYYLVTSFWFDSIWPLLCWSAGTHHSQTTVLWICFLLKFVKIQNRYSVWHWCLVKNYLNSWVALSGPDSKENKRKKNWKENET